VAKQQRVDVCTELRQLASGDETSLPRVITDDLAPCDFILFPKMKLKLKGRRFDTIKEIQAESQRVLVTLIEKDFQEAFQNGGDGGTGVYMRAGTTSRVMAADKPYDEFYDFYIISPEYFEYHLVQQHVCCVMVYVLIYNKTYH
jgi:hypothetical protein